MAVLWMKFPDEELHSAQYTEAAKQRLEAVFSTDDPKAPWMQALDMLKLAHTRPGTQLIKWHQGVPYFNGSCLIETASGQSMRAKKKSDGTYSVAVSYKIRALLSLIASQWKLEKFWHAGCEDSLAGSIALGLVMQSLLTRLGSNAERLAEWLANPAAVPASYKKIVMQFQAVQMRRTAMSHVWKGIFPAYQGQIPEGLPAFFWDDDAPEIAKPETVRKTNGPWKGLPVCAGVVTGRAVIMSGDIQQEHLDALKLQYNAPLILVFKSAKPQTVEYFEKADALIFCTGGVMSHACTVARDMNIPSVTAIGPGFIDDLSPDKIWLTIDGGTGIVTIT